MQGARDAVKTSDGFELNSFIRLYPSRILFMHYTEGTLFGICWYHDLTPGGILAANLNVHLCIISQL